jgi:hypothetical protein
MDTIRRFWNWITGGEAVTVPELQRSLILYSEMI